MRAADWLASVAVFAIVLFFGAMADFDEGSKVDYALGVVTATLAFLIANATVDRTHHR